MQITDCFYADLQDLFYFLGIFSDFKTLKLFSIKQSPYSDK